MKELFQKIIDTRSLHVIRSYAEDALETTTGTPEERSALEKINNTNSLDEAWMHAHEQLGNKEEVVKLQAWLKGKTERDRLHRPLDPVITFSMD